MLLCDATNNFTLLLDLANLLHTFIRTYITHKFSIPITSPSVVTSRLQLSWFQSLDTSQQLLLILLITHTQYWLSIDEYSHYVASALTTQTTAYCPAMDSIESSYVIVVTVLWHHSLAGWVYTKRHVAMSWVGICDVTLTSCCAIQTFIELSPSNIPIQSAVLMLHACP